MRHPFAGMVVAAVAALAVASMAPAQEPRQGPTDYRPLYTKREVMIPMRDGVRLYTAIYSPRDTVRRHPIVLTRTPYSSGPYGADTFPGFFRHSWIPAFASSLRASYIFVYQDVRGRWMSEGTFVDARPYIEHKRSTRDVDESSDAWDTVEWLIHNVAGNNGRVGLRGTSYPGFYAAMAAIDAHPAIRVVATQAPVIEWMGGDDFIHNGAFLLSHAFDFLARNGRPRPAPTKEETPDFDHGTPDGYDFFLHKLGTLANANLRFFHDSIAFWDSLAAHPTWDAFWQERSVRPHLRNLRPAMLWVGGWFDTENLWGSLNGHAAAEAGSPGAVNRLVMGPWSHGQWSSGAADSLGAMAWGSATGAFFEDSLRAPLFNAYLLDDATTPPRAYEVAAFNTGINAWRFLDRWPPRHVAARKLYLQAGGGLAFASPRAQGTHFDQYVSDPARPVPYTAAIAHWYDRAFMVEDQRFTSRRPDVLVYQTPVLDSGLTVAGPIDVDFRVSTSGTDCDWVVKVIDVFPDAGEGPTEAARRATGGYQMLLRGDVLRGKYRNSMTRPEPFVPGAVTPLKFRLNDVFHTFRPGHRIMVQVQSTWFPMIDRNPGRFMDIWHATDADFQPTTQRVYRSAAEPSHLVLPVVPGML